MKIEIAKATCDDEKSIRSLTALLETKDSWTVNSLYLKTFSINVDCDFAALSDLLSRQNKTKIIKSLKIREESVHDKDSIRNMAEHLETLGSWTVDKVCLEGAAGQGEWTGIKGGEGGEFQYYYGLGFSWSF